MTDWQAALAGADTIEQICTATLSAARRIALADGATFVLREGTNCFYVDEDAIAPLWRGQRFPMAECISGWAMQHGDVAEVPDIELDERIPIAAYRPTFVRSLTMTPMGAHKPVGAVGVYWCTPAHRVSAFGRNELIQLANAAGAAVRRVGIAAAPWAPTFAATAR